MLPDQRLPAKDTQTVAWTNLELSSVELLEGLKQQSLAQSSLGQV